MGRISMRGFGSVVRQFGRYGRRASVFAVVVTGGCGGSAARPVAPAPTSVLPAAAGSPVVMNGPATPAAVAGPVFVAHAAAANEPPVTPDQVVVWSTQGTRDDIIIDRIERSRAVFRLSPVDEQHLRRQGVSSDVIVAMRESCWR